jgi:geranylgeranylglycerol-phosphate geranylgeranyltransferase
VLVGAFVAGRPTAWGPAAAGAACAFLAASGANALNDVLDREADAVNRPERPIPAGAVAPGAAAGLSAGLSVAAVALAIPLGGWAFALVASWVGLTALYSGRLRAVPVAGNVIVSIVAASPFVLGALSQGDARAALVPTGLAFVVHLAREAVKGAEDVAGDAAAGFRTLAVVAGPPAAVAMARAAIALAMVAAPVPYFAGYYGLGYGIAVAAAEAVLGGVLYVIKGEPDPSSLRIASYGLKLAMVVGVAAFALGVIT